MHSRSLRELARRRVLDGETTTAVAADLGVAQTAVWRWANRTLTSDGAAPCPRQGDGPSPAAYAYLLGQYLGDGHLVTRAKTPVLRIYACTDYPSILEQTCLAIAAVRGRAPSLVRASDSDRLVKVQSYWKHWPCVFPQHGPGAKHTRPIVLAKWQRDLVVEHPWPLIRGLIHSDGCRAINRVTIKGKTYEYPRYFLSNESRDILAICGDALDRVGVPWRYNRPNSISVARRDAVAVMDHQVGAKC